LAEFDFTGKGYVTRQDFMKSSSVRQMQTFSNDRQRPLTLPEINLLLDDWNLFNSNGCMTTENFGCTFFPHLTINDGTQKNPDDTDDLHID